MSFELHSINDISTLALYEDGLLVFQANQEEMYSELFRRGLDLSNASRHFHSEDSDYCEYVRWHGTWPTKFDDFYKK